MAYREQTAWLALAAMAIAYGGYFLAVGRIGTLTLPAMLTLFAGATAVRLVILGGGHAMLSHRAGGDARAPIDERDLAIRRRAIEFAYYVLMAAMIMVGMVMPFHQSGMALVNAALAGIVAAEIVCYGLMVISYRRG